MLGLGNLLMLAGYTLIYAATANGGAFASNPWQGLWSDAYQQDSGAGAGSSSSGGGGSLASAIAGAIGKGAENTLVGSKTASKANSNIAGAARINEQWGRAIVNAIKGALQGKPGAQTGHGTTKATPIR